jgi:hypothetical protein
LKKSGRALRIPTGQRRKRRREGRREACDVKTESKWTGILGLSHKEFGVGSLLVVLASRRVSSSHVAYVSPSFRYEFSFQMPNGSQMGDLE